MTTPPASAPVARPESPLRVALARGAAFFVLWIVLTPSAKPADLVFGAFATVAATWASLRLLPPETGRLRVGVLLALVPHLLWESLLAAIDVARRALAPSVRLDPGLVKCPLNFPPGLARNTFASITSLLPGSVPVGEDEGVLIYHALDITQPVVEQLCEEERLLARALVVGQRHD